MKKTFKYALAVVAAVATVACSQFDEQDIAPEAGGENMVPMTITVGNEPTRVNIGDDSKSINLQFLRVQAIHLTPKQVKRSWSIRLLRALSMAQVQLLRAWHPRMRPSSMCCIHLSR